MSYAGPLRPGRLDPIVLLIVLLNFEHLGSCIPFPAVPESIDIKFAFASLVASEASTSFSVSGYRNSAYFVNWLVHMSMIDIKLSTDRH